MVCHVRKWLILEISFFCIWHQICAKLPSPIKVGKGNLGGVEMQNDFFHLESGRSTNLFQQLDNPNIHKETQTYKGKKYSTW